MKTFSAKLHGSVECSHLDALAAMHWPFYCSVELHLDALALLHWPFYCSVELAYLDAHFDLSNSLFIPQVEVRAGTYNHRMC